MFHSLTERIKPRVSGRAYEHETDRLLNQSLRMAGVLVTAILVFVILYFFVAALE